MRAMVPLQDKQVAEEAGRFITSLSVNIICQSHSVISFLYLCELTSMHMNLGLGLCVCACMCVKQKTSLSVADQWFPCCFIKFA